MNISEIEVSAPHHFQTVAEYLVILGNYRKKGYSFTLHNYFPTPPEAFILNIASENEYDRRLATNLVNNAAFLAKSINSPVYGIHAGYLGNAREGENGMFSFSSSSSSYQEALKLSVEFINEINPTFEKAGIRLLIENLFPLPGDGRALFCSLDEIFEFMNNVPQSVGLLLDLGHLNISSNILGFDRNSFIDKYFTHFGDRVLEIHLSENGGVKDDHLALKKNSWQLDVIRSIKDENTLPSFERVFCLEARNATKECLVKSIAMINEIIC